MRDRGADRPCACRAGSGRVDHLEPMPGTLFLVATPIGNLEDLTFRALRVLKTVDVIAAEDTRRTGGLLAHYGIQTPTMSFHEHNEQERTSTLLEHLRSGKN